MLKEHKKEKKNNSCGSFYIVLFYSNLNFHFSSFPHNSTLNFPFYVLFGNFLPLFFLYELSWWNKQKQNLTTYLEFIINEKDLYLGLGKFSRFSRMLNQKKNFFYRLNKICIMTIEGLICPVRFPTNFHLRKNLS